MDSTDELDIRELQNLQNVKNIVKRSENPHPLILCCIILCTVIIMYYLYVVKFKHNITGQWMDDDNHIHLIQHNIWKDKLLVDNYNSGVVRGNTVIVYENHTMRMGVLLEHSIYWTDGTSWQQIFGA